MGRQFEINGARYGVPDLDEDWGTPTRDERSTRLDAVAVAGRSFLYTYDFGDGWDHTVAVEKVVPAESATTLPACIGGRRHCPPEDCGGPWGYQNLLAALTDPDHPEHEELTEWVGGPFDPEAFDPADFAENLRSQELASFDDPL